MNIKRYAARHHDTYCDSGEGCGSLVSLNDNSEDKSSGMRRLV